MVLTMSKRLEHSYSFYFEFIFGRLLLVVAFDIILLLTVFTTLCALPPIRKTYEKVSIQQCHGGSAGIEDKSDRLGSKALYAFIYPNFMVNR